jgi:predicted nucleic acid-binding protein
MVLVDTSVWVAHLRRGEVELSALLEEGKVACHPYIIGELACGNLANRKEILGLLQSLPQSPAVSHEEVLRFLELRGLVGIGLGCVDVHLLASACLSFIPIWTLDAKLREAAKKIGISFD